MDDAEITLSGSAFKILAAATGKTGIANGREFEGQHNKMDGNIMSDKMNPHTTCQIIFILSNCVFIYMKVGL